MVRARGWRVGAGCLLLALVLLGTGGTGRITAAAAREAAGSVFHDRDGDGVRDPGEDGIPGVGVSNGSEVVLTDPGGEWRLPVATDAIFFVLKPRGWMTRVDANHLPRFHYIHKPAGSPPLRYPGVAPTGELPGAIDFPLTPRDEPDAYRVLLFGDTQVRDARDVEYLTRDIIEPLIGTDAAFGVTLGDLTFDDLSLFGPLNERVGRIGIPWYHVIGNHDHNHDAPDDARADDTFERVYGPPYYAFDVGRIHFLVLDDALRQGWRYRAGLGAAQMAFVRNDLALVPPDRPVVLLMHIPIYAIEGEEQRELLRLLAARPRSLSISAHTHTHRHLYLGAAEGWPGLGWHHHIVHGAAAGSWWRGAPDEHGIPHATMGDGTPNGYGILSLAGDDYHLEYRAARRPADYQMNIHAPERVKREDLARTAFWVNVFNGSERSLVEARADGREPSWRVLQRVVARDPWYEELHKRDLALAHPGRPLPGPALCHHLWRGTLPPDLAPGAHVIEVRATDAFGWEHVARRIIQVE